MEVYAIGEDVTISTLSGDTRTSDGTSFSTAKVTAIAAKMMQENRNLDIQQLREQMKQKQH